MIAKVAQDELAKVLHRVLPATSRNAGIPVYGGVRLSGEDGELVLETTDGDIYASVRLAAEVSDGTALVPAALLGALVDRCVGTIELERTEAKCHVRSNGFNADIFCLVESDWPRRPSADGAVLGDGILISELDRLTFAASRDSSRPILTAVGVGDGWAATTDSFRLAAMELNSDATGLIPAAALHLAGKVVDDGVVALADRHAVFKGPAGTMTARLIEGTPPSWKGLVPNPTGAIAVERAPLKAAVERILTVSVKENPVLVVEGLGNALRLWTKSPVGSCEELLAAASLFAEPIFLQARHLIQALEAIDDDDVTLEIETPTKPVMIHQGGLLQLLQPMHETALVP